jgi:hypothetical protein
MKTKSKNMALEGTCSGDVVGGLLLWTGEKPSGAFVFLGRAFGLVLGNKKPLRTDH